MRKTTIALICIGLLVIAAIGAIVFVKTAPKAEKKRPPRMAALVQTQPLIQTDETVVVYLTGTVSPAKEVMLRARVSGEVVSMSPDFIEGGLLPRDADILNIDPVDYELALAAARSALETARFNYKIELGRQDVARREWELLKTDDASDLEKELALRTPHLAASKASLEAAEASLKKAEIDLSRTKIRTPFNAVVLERRVNLGSQASMQDILAVLAGTDTYWITVSVPVDRLEWITVPGSSARIISNSGAVREGRVIKLLGDLEERGRMARLLVEVEDPLCLQPENRGAKPLLLGEYVRAEISGSTLKGVSRIPRNALRENDQIWMAADGQLDIRKAEVLWRDAENVLIRADGTGEGLLIVSDLNTPIQGMDVNPGQGRAKTKPLEEEIEQVREAAGPDEPAR
jgi:multidrug efflux pump subunit AcrA (membrane-fusion protein)